MKRREHEIEQTDEHSLSRVERQILDLLRDETKDGDFSLTIRKKGDRYFITQVDLSDRPVPQFGSGETLEDAWRSAGIF